MADASAAADEIRILSAGAMREIVLELGDGYRNRTGTKFSAEFTRSPLVRDRLRAGEIVDLAITTRSRIDELARETMVIAATAVPLARSGIGVAVRAGAGRPEIGSVDAFVRSLQAAETIACADPAFGTASGLHLAALFDRLGISDELKPKLRLVGATGGKPVVVCEAVANGEAQLGIQQIAEIVAVPGVELVGPLPAALQHTTVFAAAVATAARRPDMARDLLTFLASADARLVVAAHGMQPA